MKTGFVSTAMPAPSLASLLAQGHAGQPHAASLRRLQRRAAAPLALAVALVGLWCAQAPLAGAVIASGQVRTELGRKTVQHLEGGIVREVLVREGQQVKRGDPLLVVADLRSDAALELLRRESEAERVRAARVRAELGFAARVTWPDGASSDVIAREHELFESRRLTLNAQLAALHAQRHDAQARIAALSSQLEAWERSTRLARDELAIHAPLAEGGFIQKTRLIALERDLADRVGRLEATRAQIAEARMQASALANALAQARGSYLQHAAQELTDTSARLREIQERLRPSQDQAERQTVRAPVDGAVMKLRVSAPGIAVGPREPLLEIVPDAEPLVVEVRIDPHDIDNVRPGGDANVRLSAFDARTTPLLEATVTSVSPDAAVDPATQRASYVAQVEVTQTELARHPQLRLRAGMPAEVFITTPPRSLFEYLLEPIGLFASRAMREP